MAFKAIGVSDPDVFACGQGVDTDPFINGMLGRAEAAVDRFLDEQFNPHLEAQIQNMPIREAIVMVVRNRATRALMERHLGPSASLILQHGSIDLVADFIANQLRGQTERTIRILVQTIKDRVIAELRNQVKRQLNTWLTTVVNTLCVRGFVTVAEVMAELARQMGQLVANALPQAVEVVVIAMISEMLSAIGNALLEILKWIGIAVAVVIAAIVLWEVVAAIAASAALESILAFVGGLLARLVPLFGAA